MSIKEQQKFIENFEKILEKKSKHYRRYTGNRQHHNFTVSQAGLERGVKDTLEFSLAGNKEKNSPKRARSPIQNTPLTFSFVHVLAQNPRIHRRSPYANGVVGTLYGRKKCKKKKAGFCIKKSVSFLPLAKGFSFD